jgi:hypothetical protein
MHCFSNLFDKVLYMFQTDLLSTIRSLNTVFTSRGICQTSYVDCLLVRSGWNREIMHLVGFYYKNIGIRSSFHVWHVLGLCLCYCDSIRIHDVHVCYFLIKCVIITEYCTPTNALIIYHIQWTLKSRTQSVPRGGLTFSLFDFRVKWHESHDAVQCHAHGSTFEFLFEFQTEFFSNFLFPFQFVRESNRSTFKGPLH